MRVFFPLSPYNQQRQFQKPIWVYPALLAMYATYLRDQGHHVDWEHADGGNYDKIVHDDSGIVPEFKELPYPDRIFTNAKNKRWQSYGNYKYHPATHMMSASGCLHGRCSFCFEKDKDYMIRDPIEVAEEVQNCVRLGFKEVFDDAATLPRNSWLKNFGIGLEWLGVRGKIVLGCNLRIDCDNDFVLMKHLGYRMVLFGVESANQMTLNRIHKGINVKNIENTLHRATSAGLEPHITVMFGYPWETKHDARNTVEMVHRLLKKGYAKSVQASIFCPPRTRPAKADPNHAYIKEVYDIYKHPLYWYQKIKDIRSWQDFTYLLKRINLIGGAE